MSCHSGGLLSLSASCYMFVLVKEIEMWFQYNTKSGLPMEPFSIHSWEEVNSVHLSQVWKSLESVWWMLWWLQHHLWREGGTRGGPASSGVLGWMPVKHKSHLKTVVPDAIIKSVCVSLDRNMPSGGRFFRPPAVLFLFLLTEMSSYFCPALLV